MPPRRHHFQPLPPLWWAVGGGGLAAAAVDSNETPLNPPENPRSITSVGAVRRQTTIVVAVGRRYSHHSRTMWCRAVAAQPLGVPCCAQPLGFTAVAAAEPAVATTATTAAP
ncbi:hypothetical protein Tco_1209825 [Tanacetum coccineum]